jgi:drug/metabolite transporter (DMT)-like permease
MLVSREGSPQQQRATAAGVGWATASALGVGLFILLMAAMATGRLLCGLWLQRAVALTITGIWYSRLTRRAPIPRSCAGMIITVGVCDIVGTVALAYALDKAPLAIVASSAGLYPLTTVALGALFLHERLIANQYAGVIAAVAGLVLVNT